MPCSGGKTVHLLPLALDYSASTGGLPPIFEPGQKARSLSGTSGKDARNRFLRTAMKYSGEVPGKGLASGRKAQAPGQAAKKK
jgi:hypothetical protein